ncbi:MAG: four helix bundle protein [Patescibacteria group bacterium]
MKKRSEFKYEFKKRCYQFSLSVLKLSEQLIVKSVNKVLIDQLIRSATSVGANVVEGSYGSSKKEFVNYFQISVKSASETLYWLSLLQEMNVDLANTIKPLINECVEIRKLLSTIILNTKSNSKF